MTSSPLPKVNITHPGAEPQNNTIGMAAMAGAMICLIGSDALVKLVSERLPLGEILFVRGALMLIAMVPAVIMLGAWRPLSTVLAPAFRWRLIGEVSAVIFYFAALFRLPLADVNALIQFAPIATMMAVAILFREPVGWRRWSAAGVGLIGVLAIIGPGTETFSPYALLVLVAVVGIAIRDIATREMDRSLPGLYIAFITALAITLLGVAHLPFEQWSWPVRNDLLALGFSGGFLLGAYMLMVVALRRGEISVVSPFRFTKMIWAIAIGYLVWGEVPGPLASFGFVLVMAAGLFIFFRERALEKSAARA